MRAVIDRLLAPEEPPRRFGTVRDVLPDGRYRVVDERLRIFTVDGAAGYLPGGQVVISAGRIVGSGSRAPIGTTVRV